MFERETEMFSLRSLALSVVCLAVSASLIQGQDLSRYREFEFGMTLAAVAQQARLTPTAARLVHQRPQLIQELDWHPQQQQRAGAAESEAVDRVRFTFFDGRLYQITVGYDRSRVEGLTAEDFVQAISASYGPVILVSTQLGGTAPPRGKDLILGGDQTVAAQWADLQFSVTLLRTTYPSAFELQLLARQPDLLARAATLAATRLDVLEAPQLDIDRRQKQADEERAKAEKARGVNKPLFRF
jgi:hypothetical protein